MNGWLVLSLLIHAVSVAWLVSQERRIDRLKLHIGYARESAVKLTNRVSGEVDELRVAMQRVETKGVNVEQACARRLDKTDAAVAALNQQLDVAKEPKWRRKRA